MDVAYDTETAMAFLEDARPALPVNFVLTSLFTARKACARPWPGLRGVLEWLYTAGGGG